MYFCFVFPLLHNYPQNNRITELDISFYNVKQVKRGCHFFPMQWDFVPFHDQIFYHFTDSLKKCMYIIWSVPNAVGVGGWNQPSTGWTTTSPAHHNAAQQWPNHRLDWWPLAQHITMPTAVTKPPTGWTTTSPPHHNAAQQWPNHRLDGWPLAHHITMPHSSDQTTDWMGDH